MKRKSIAILFFLALLCCFLGCKQDLAVEQITKTPTIRGSVSIPSGSGLSGSDFFVRVMEGEKAVYTGKVNSDGSFSVQGLKENISYSILLTTDEPGDIAGSSRDVSRAETTSGYGGWLSNVTASMDSQTGVGSIKVKPLGTIRGKVTKNGAEDGYDTTVYIPGTSYMAMTDGEGNFSIFNVPQATYTLRFISNGYMAKMLTEVVLHSDSDTENPVITIAEQTLIKNAGNLIGSITKLGTSDSSGITVMLTNDRNVYTDSTAVDGSLLMSGLVPGVYTATISSSGFVTKTIENIEISAASNTTIDPIVIVANGGRIIGSVTMNDGGDVSGVLITARSSDDRYSYTTSTDSTGVFIIANAYPGSYTLTLTKPDYAIVTITEVLSMAGQGTDVGTFTFSSDYGTVEGIVTDTLGNAIENAIVKVGEINILTGADGRFSKTGIPVGNYSVTISKEGYTTKTLAGNITVESSNTVSLESIELVSIFGSVSGKTSLQDSIDNSGVTITLTYVADSNIAYTAVSGVDGTYTFSNLTKAGQYSVTFSKAGYISRTGVVANVVFGENQILDDVTLITLASKVNGRVILEGSDDLSGISVLLKASDDSVQYDATTDQQGNWVMARVNPGEYYLLVSKSGYVSKTINSIVVESSTEKTLDSVSLSIGVRSITGTALAELKTNHSGSLITATNLSDQTRVYSAISNSDGVYTLAGMVPGEYSIVISHTGYRSLTLPTVNVIEGSTKTLEAVEIEINRGTISGVATLERRTSSSGIQVELLQGLTVVATDSTDESGEYSFYVPQGNYSGVRLTKTDFRTETVSSSIALFADNFISIENTELKATANSVYGIADVLTTDDDSDATISFDGHDEIPAVVTEEDGAFRFDHIPIGNYNLRFQRENCSDIVVPISVVPSDGINLNTVTITPNTATIKGKVNLENGNSLAGVLVSVDMGTKTAMGYTDASGRYEIGGVSVADTYNVTYSKTGWDSYSQQITPVLERLEVREMDEITLVDTTSPVLNSIVINNGANTAADRHVTLHFNAFDFGSGVSKVMVTYDNVFDRTVTRHDYNPNFEWELPSGNGLKTIYVKVVDAAGNESNTVSTSVTLTDQKKEVRGVLTGDDLHWTEELSPYLVTGHIMVEDGKTLIIDPGVDVQFAGLYYIQVEGVLKAIGTEAKVISFYGIDDGVSNWDGINVVNSNGSRMSYVYIEGLRNGINGNIEVCHAEVLSLEYAFGSSNNCFNGTVYNSRIVGAIKSSEGSYIGNRIETSSFVSDYDKFSGNIVEGINSTIKIEHGLVENTKFTELIVRSKYTGMVNSSLENCTAYLDNGGLYWKCLFSNCSFPIFNPAIVRESNIIDCGTVNITTSRAYYLEVDLGGNFWGYDKTREMDENSIDGNLSFITDYYDDFNKTKAVLTGYKNEPIANVGYLGDVYYPDIEESLVEYEIGDTGPAGGIVFYDKGYYSEGWRYLETSPTPVYKGDPLYYSSSSYAFGYYRITANDACQSIGTGFGVGTGRINTVMLVEAMGDAAYRYSNGETTITDYAALVCDNYVLNGFDDWFFPSEKEVKLRALLVETGLVNEPNIWSSSEHYNSPSEHAVVRGYSVLSQMEKGDYHQVFPVRAF